MRTMAGSSKLWGPEPPVSLCVPVLLSPACRALQLNTFLRLCPSGLVLLRCWGEGCWFLTQEREELPHGPSLAMPLVPLQPARTIHQVLALCFPRWSDGSLLNFVSWAPGKPRPINKDKKCVYMTASRGEEPHPAVLGSGGAEGCRLS